MIFLCLRSRISQNTQKPGVDSAIHRRDLRDPIIISTKFVNKPIDRGNVLIKAVLALLVTESNITHSSCHG